MGSARRHNARTKVSVRTMENNKSDEPHTRMGATLTQDKELNCRKGCIGGIVLNHSGCSGSICRVVGGDGGVWSRLTR